MRHGPTVDDDELEKKLAQATNSSLNTEESVKTITSEKNHACEKCRPTMTAQERYINWCKKNSYDPPTVTEIRAVKYLKEEVIDKQTNGRKFSKIKSEVRGIADLFQKQKNCGNSEAKEPRGLVMNQLLRDCRIQTTEIERDATDNDVEIFEQIQYILFKLNSPYALETRLAFLLGHVTLFCGNHIRGMELADWSCHTPKTHDTTPLEMYNVFIDHGKTKQEVIPEYRSTIRHKDPRNCLVNALARYLFYRFEMTDEGLPDISSRENWYFVKTIIGQQGGGVTFDRNRQFRKAKGPTANTKTIPRSMHNDSMNFVYQMAGITTTKGVTLIKESGTRISSKLRTSVDETSHTSVVRKYLYDVPQGLLRLQAGCKAASVGSYFIPRANINPPECLLDMIFPGVEEKLAEVHTRTWRHARLSQQDPGEQLASHIINDLHSSDRSKVKSHIEKIKACFDSNDVQQGSPALKDGAAANFLKMLIKLRRVILQDMAVLSEFYPDDIILSHPVFRHRAFGVFAREVRYAHNNSINMSRIGVQIHTGYPELCENFEKIRDQLSSDANSLESTRLEIAEIKRNLVELKEKLNESKEELNEVKENQNELLREVNEMKDQISYGHSDLKEQVVKAVLMEMVAPVNQSLGGAGQKRNATTAFGDTAQPKQQRTVQGDSSDILNVSEEFNLRRDHDNVRVLWDEWTKADPCVEYMDAKYGSSWRRDEENSRFYNRRKIVIDGIKNLLEIGHCNEERALVLAEECQNSFPHMRSLNKLARLVKKNMQFGSHPFKHFDPADPKLPTI
jgi:hypothetical protein